MDTGTILLFRIHRFELTHDLHSFLMSVTKVQHVSIVTDRYRSCLLLCDIVHFDTKHSVFVYTYVLAASAMVADHHHRLVYV
jgi:hypothetical protein